MNHKVMRISFEWRDQLMPGRFLRSNNGALYKRLFSISLCFFAALLAVAGCGGGPGGGGADVWTVASLDLTGAQALVIDQSGGATRELYKITVDGEVVLVDYLDEAGQPLPALPAIHPVDWLYHVDEDHIIIPLAREASIKTFLINKSTGAAHDISAAGVPMDFDPSVDGSRRLEVQTDHAGGIYFIDRSAGNFRRLVKVDTAHGNAVTTVSRPGAVVYAFRVDGAGNVVYADGGSNRYRVINAQGNYVTTFESIVYDEFGNQKHVYNCFVGLDDKFHFFWGYNDKAEIVKETLLANGTLQTPSVVYGTVPPGTGEDHRWFLLYCTGGSSELRLQNSIYYLSKSNRVLSEAYNSSSTPALYPPIATFTAFTSINIVDWTDANIYAIGQNASNGVIATYNPTTGIVSRSIANLTFDQAIVLADGTIYFAGENNSSPVLGKISSGDTAVDVIKENADIVAMERL